MGALITDVKCARAVIGLTSASAVFAVAPSALADDFVSSTSGPCDPAYSVLDTIGNLYGGNRALAVADFDGDGDLDVAGGRVADGGSIYFS